jgi:hypothetical protein
MLKFEIRFGDREVSRRSHVVTKGQTHCEIFLHDLTTNLNHDDEETPTHLKNDWMVIN